MASTKGHEEVVRLLLQSGVRDMANKVTKYFSISLTVIETGNILFKCAPLCMV